MTEDNPVFDYKYIQSMFHATSKRLHKVFTIMDYTWTGSIPSEYEINELLLRFYKEAENTRKNAKTLDDCVQFIASGRVRIDFYYYLQDGVDNPKIVYDDIVVSMELGNFWNHWTEDLGHGVN